MAKKIARSARGDIVDFDVLAITAAMASAPAPGLVQARREFIDEKDGLKSRARIVSSTPVEVDPAPIASSASDAMALAFAAVEESAAASELLQIEEPVSKSKLTK